MILDEIVDKKKQQLIIEKQQIDIEEWSRRIKELPEIKKLSFYEALSSKKDISIIAEVKKASPSKGVIREDFNHIEIAEEYAKSKVAAISVLTEKHFFQGNDDYLSQISAKIETPLLRKDFIIDPWQIYQSRCLGASAILLIVKILNDAELLKFRIIAEILGMDCLVEVHDVVELDVALSTGAKIIGINNRNLNTFEVSLKTTENLIHKISSDIIKVSESGIRTYEDIKTLKDMGANAVLVGETLMRSGNIGEALAKLRGQ